MMDRVSGEGEGGGGVRPPLTEPSEGVREGGSPGP